MYTFIALENWVNVNDWEVSQHLEVSHMATMKTTTKKYNS